MLAAFKQLLLGVGRMTTLRADNYLILHIGNYTAKHVKYKTQVSSTFGP
jgi:hypothetical protein